MRYQKGLFNVKVGLAVFLSLAVIAFSINIAEEDDFAQNNTGVIETIQDTVSQLTQTLDTQPEPNNTVQIDVESPEVQELGLTVSEANLTAENLNELEWRDRSVTSEHPITLISFQGEIQNNENQTSLRGTSEGYTTPETSMDGEIDVNTDLNHTTKNIENIERTPFSLNNATGQINSEESNVEINDETLDIDSFTGNITINTSEQMIEMNGKVNRLESGTLTIS